MSRNFRRAAYITILGVLASSAIGCAASYKGLVKPAAKMGALSPDLADWSSATIERFLQTDVQPTFPTVLAVARLQGHGGYDWRRDDTWSAVEMPQDEELATWRRLASSGQGPVSQVQFISPVLVVTATLDSLRSAAARLHAPLLFVYGQAASGDQGYNSAAIAYWTILGLFLVPGNTVGHYSACYGVLVDTRTGAILATVEGESKKEEQVLPGAVEIAQRRTEKQSRTEAVSRLQHNFQEALRALAESGPSRRPAQPPSTAPASSSAAP